MNLYLLTQTQNNEYDTYDSCVVAATDETEARKIHPSPNGRWDFLHDRSWASSPEAVTVELIGTAKRGTKPGVICASFNAG